MTSSGERILDLAEPSPAAEAVAGNGDLLREILLRLPVKSLLRFESVSKEWLSLITNPHFAQNYTRRHNPNLEPSGLLLKNLVFEQFQFVPLNDDGDGDGDGAESRVKLSYPADPGIMILQSCNGLLLCYSKHWKENNSVLVYYICNPTTKQFAPIYLPSRELEASLVAVNLAFDPLKSPHYKLIFIRVVDEPSFTYQIDIYYSETPHLRPPASGHPLIFTAPPEICFRGPVHCNGIIHWNSRTKTSLCFDADTEQLYSMPMPPFPDGFQLENNCFFVESRGHLHLVVMDVPPIMEFDIWELKTDYSGWFIRYRVDLYPVAITFPEIIPTPENGYEIFRFLSVVRAEKEEDSTLVIVVAGEAISFNLNDKTSKKICDILVPWYKVYGSIIVEAFHAHQYIEMLFRV